ncbi:MAG: hypothetical protein GC191_06625 [Azospirillum sp.]|nr:hypothetical protein [Azospirillum sp.]
MNMELNFLTSAEQLETGCQAVDRGRNGLLKVYRDVVALVQPRDDHGVAADDVAAFADACDRLVARLQQHFDLQEALMWSQNYPRRERHKQVHDHFLGEIRYLAEGVKGETVVNGAANFLAEMVGRWLISHTSADDRELAAFLRDRGFDGDDAGCP